MKTINSPSMRLDQRAAWGRKYLSMEGTNVGQRYTFGSPFWSRTALCMTLSKCLWNGVGPTSFWKKKCSSLDLLWCGVPQKQ